MTKKRLEELIGKLEPKMARRFRSIMQRVKSGKTLAQLEAALEGGAIGEVIDDIEKAAAQIAAQNAAAHNLVAGEVAAALADKLNRLVSYDGTNRRAVQALAARRFQFMWGLREDQRLSIGEATRSLSIGEEARIRGALAGGLVNGVNPRRTAIAIRDSIGLTPIQTQWVANYRRKLETLDPGALANKLRDARTDAAVRAAIAAGKPLPQARIDKLVDRYAERQLKYRAEVIARTETLRSVHEAQDEAYQQAIDDGHVDADRLQLEWHSGDPPRTRTSHARMDHQLRRHGEAFRSGDGFALRHPGDRGAPASETAQCRCRVTRRVLPEGEVSISEGDASNPHADEDKANRAALKAMAKKPMATVDHPAVDMSGLSAADRTAFEDRVAATFGRRIPISEMTHAFAPPRGYTARFDDVFHDGDRHGLTLGYYNADGDRIGVLSREFRPNGELHLGLMSFERAYQSAGIGSTVQGQTALRYQSWGAKVDSLDALWVGRYSWARQGYRFDSTPGILAAGEKFIAANVPEELRGSYTRALARLTREPWKLSKWDDGKRYDVFFDDGDGQARGSYAFGKALLLHHGMPAWSGRLIVDGNDEGFLNALRLLAVQGRL